MVDIVANRGGYQVTVVMLQNAQWILQHCVQLAMLFTTTSSSVLRFTLIKVEVFTNKTGFIRPNNENKGTKVSTESIPYKNMTISKGS